MSRLLPCIAAATAALAFALPVHAVLTGDTVGTRYVGAGGDTGVEWSVVGLGEEGLFFDIHFYDYGPTSFRIGAELDVCGVFLCDGQPISLELSSLDLGGPITDVTTSTSLVGVTTVFTADSITFSWAEQSIAEGLYLSAEINAVAVPEPETYALMGLGIFAVGAFVRRSRRG